MKSINFWLGVALLGVGWLLYREVRTISRAIPKPIPVAEAIKAASIANSYRAADFALKH
jgi:hypothetical protein